MDKNKDYHGNILKNLENRESNRKGRKKREEDKEYFQQLYPWVTKQYLRAVKYGIDKIEGKNSFIYDEYPDRIRLELLLDSILETIPYEKRIPRESQKQILRILIYDDICMRRLKRE